MILAEMQKTPTDKLDYDVAFQRWLPNDDQIAAAVATAEGGTATVSLVEFDDFTAKVWVEGGAHGETNNITVTITTTDGRVKQAAFELKIREI
jgi:hypothetical protein